MDITREALEKRLMQLETQKRQLLGHVNACEGGIIVVNDLLTDLDKKADPKPVRLPGEPAEPEKDTDG